MTKVLVLEDSPERVEWLRNRFPKLDLIHALTPLDFADGMKENPALVILDHDLGLPAWDGWMAAQLMPEYDETCTTPVIVWSINPVGGPRMRRFLSDAGFPCWHFMFGIQADSISLAIRKLIEG